MRQSSLRFWHFVYLFCRVLCFCFVVKERRLKKNFKSWMWKRFKKKVRLCRLFFYWIFCVEKRLFWLRVLWFDFDFLFYLLCLSLLRFSWFLWFQKNFRMKINRRLRRFFRWEKKSQKLRKKLSSFRVHLFVFFLLRLSKVCSFLSFLSFLSLS